jgi:hypothetical protein
MLGISTEADCAAMQISDDVSRSYSYSDTEEDLGLEMGVI